MRLLLAILLAPLLLAGQDEKRAKAARPTAEITLRIVEATSAANAANDAADLVPPELKALLRFSKYRLLDSAFLRGVEEETMRVALAGNLSGEVRFEVRSRQPPVVEFDVEIQGPADPGKRAPVLLETTTTAKSGETVVLGASRMRDSSNALIVLLTAKLIP